MELGAKMISCDSKCFPSISIHEAPARSIVLESHSFLVVRAWASVMGYGAIMGYQAYLNSEVWAARSKAAKVRAGWKCQICSSRDGLETHHNTYDRIGREAKT